MKRVLFVTEYLNPPYDEGIKKTAFNLYKDFNQRYDLKVISRQAFENKDIHVLSTNPLFISKEIKSLIQKFNPDTLVYFPFASSTFAGYLRQRMLRYYLKRKRKFVFIALQPKKINFWQKLFIQIIKPPLALTPSPILKQEWDKMKIANKQLPLLTDLNIFKPLKEPVSKKELRKKYQLPSDAFIISHMGHLNEGRNLQSLIPLQKAGYQVVVVGSSSTPKDSLGHSSLKENLVKEGIIILDGYIENIEDVYQLSDLYIFPVVAKTGSIGMPLSIMEARGCGKPVLTTDFGSLQHYLADDNKSIWYKKPEDFLSTVKEIEKSLPRDFSKSNVAQINKKFYSIIHSAIEDTH
jgi:glycosyltransferase involved in cell wall biosynthesis